MTDGDCHPDSEGDEGNAKGFGSAKLETISLEAGVRRGLSIGLFIP